VSAWNDIRDELQHLAETDMLRDPVTLETPVGPRVRVAGREVVCLCSNDYLSLAGDPRVIQAACRGLQHWGLGAGASRLVSGTGQPHRQLERDLAAFKGVEDVAITSTGWMANQAAIAAVAGPGDLVLCDKLNHASILDAALSCGARVRTYHHRDTGRLARLLERHRPGGGRCLIVTDSVFSMDGDLAPLGEICDLKEAHDAAVLIDEAHATGVLGPGGRGAAELLGVEDRVDLVVGTLSKALGGLGGFIAADKVLIDKIRNTARPYIYTTAPPPGICVGLIESLRIVVSEPGRRRRLGELAELLRDRLGQMGLSGGTSATQIVPIVLGPAGRALRISRALLDAGFLVPAIRPPTVPRGTSRLRVSLCAGHTPAEIEAFCDALQAAVQQDEAESDGQGDDA
jgi:8-amino-7-oxononanoate synthase